MITNVNISDAEHCVIETLWSSGSMTAEQVANYLKPANDWSFATVKTLLGRLLRKKAITAKPQGRRFIYTAKLTRDDYVAAESERFINRVYDGRIAPLVSQFSQTKGLSKKDIEELQELIDKLS